MALVLKDRVRVTSSTTGTGTFTLGAASAGYQDFSVIGDGNTTYYAIQNSGDNTWEVGIGTYTASGTTLSRDTILESSNGGTAVNFGAGTKDVFVTYPAEKGLYLDASGNAIGLGTPASATLTNATGLPISTGVAGLGTGVATFLTTPSSSNLASAVTDETGTGSLVFATSPTLVTPVLGTPTSVTLTNGTGLPLTTGVTGTLNVANGGTGLTSLTSGYIPYGNGTSAFNSTSTFTFNGTTLFTPAASLSGNLTFTGTGNRITGDFSNATIANRVFLQTSTANSATGTGILPNGTATNANFRIYNNSDPTNAAYIAISTSGTESTLTSAITGTGTYLPMTFLTGGSERMRIDTSGNVGIGTTSPAYGLHVSGTGTKSYVRVSNTSGTYNAKFNVEDTGETTFGAHSNNPLLLLTNNIERMRIDSSGNVGIGVTPSAWGLSPAMDIGGGGLGFYTNGIQQNAYYNGTSWAYKTSAPATQYLTSGGMHRWGIAASGTAGNSFTFTEAMRIDSSGNVLIGTTSQRDTAITTFNGSNTIVSWIYQTTNTSGYNGLAIGLQSNGNNTSTYHLRGNTSGVGNWYLYGNGTTSYSSDERLKKNIETTRDGYIDDLCKLRVVKYNWKNDEDNKPKELGLIAQEVEQIFPNLVQDDLNTISDKDTVIYKQLKQSVLPFMLLKAIQEQQTIINDLKARIETLEGK